MTKPNEPERAEDWGPVEGGSFSRVREPEGAGIPIHAVGDPPVFDGVTGASLEELKAMSDNWPEPARPFQPDRSGNPHLYADGLTYQDADDTDDNVYRAEVSVRGGAVHARVRNTETGRASTYRWLPPFVSIEGAMVASAGLARFCNATERQRRQRVLWQRVSIALGLLLGLRLGVDLVNWLWYLFWLNI